MVLEVIGLMVSCFFIGFLFDEIVHMITGR